MSKDKNSKQMSLLEDFPANHSVLQEDKKEQTTTVISGQKCLDSLKKLNQSSLLGRMCKALLTSKTAWYSDRCKTTWKVKVSKSNVSLFQLQASVLGTKGTEFGLLATPNTMDYLPPRSVQGTKKLMEGHRKGRTKPSNLREQVDPETMKMYPTPRSSGQENPESLIKRKGWKQAAQHNLTAAVKMYPTPQRSDHLANQSETLEAWEKRAKKKKEENGVNLQFALRHAVQKEQKMMYKTPTTQDSRIGPNNLKGSQHRKKRGSEALADQILFPTPSASCQMDVVAPPETVTRNSSGWSVTRVGTGRKFGAKLNDVVNKMYHTPTRSDYKDAAYNPITCKTDLVQVKLPHQVLANNKPGGRLSPTFVEFLMGFPMDWTRIEQTESKVSETQSSHNVQE